MIFRRNVLKGMFATIAGVFAFKPALASIERDSESRGDCSVKCSVRKLSVAVSIENESEECIAAAKAKALEKLAKSSVWFLACNSQEPEIRISEVAIKVHGENRFPKCVVATKRYWVPDTYLSYTSHSENATVRISIDKDSDAA